MAYISNEVMNEIRNKTDIVDVISKYVNLTKKGKNYFGVCPFHDDHSPSMSVSPEKQIYTCFSCGASGNVFTFVADFEKISFTEAVRLLGEKVGINIGTNISVSNKKDEYFDIYGTANKFYQNSLFTNLGKNAIEYLDKSGLTLLISKIKTALNGKVDVVSGKGLSTNDYTNAEKQKLSGIASGAQANVIESVKVNGTKVEPSSKAVDISVPTKVSQLTNDSGFQTSTQVNSIVTGKGYQTQSQVQSLINSAVGNITSIRYEKVTSLPATGSNGVIYLVAHSHGTQDIYDEYIWLSETKTYEKIGNTDIDLSAYVKKSELTAITTNDLNTMWG